MRKLVHGYFFLSLASAADKNNPIQDLPVFDDTPSTRNEAIPPNLLLIVTDEHRYDILGFVQSRMKDYEGKLKVQTPNIDRIAQNGVHFENAYCQYPSCGPARTTLMTGCTSERTGVQKNSLVNDKNYNKNRKIFAEKIEKLETYEQILVEELGYLAENVGKWHVPDRFYAARDGSKRVVRYNDYDFTAKIPMFVIDGWWSKKYIKIANTLIEAAQYTRQWTEGSQGSPWIQWPYDPIRLDPRFDMSTNTPNPPRENSKIRGWSSEPEDITSTAVTGRLALEALDRLGLESRPFSLTVNFLAPHAPMLPPLKYKDFYDQNRDHIFVSPSIDDDMSNSAYKPFEFRRTGKLMYWRKSSLVQEWAAVYYACIQEVDEWVGQILDKLDALGLTDKTLVVFTADHGEMLGAHARDGKATFYEESTRVPLLMSLPGTLPKGRSVRVPVSHLDVFSTILDYTGGSDFDFSDGKSLRRFIKFDSANAGYDEHYVVSEMDDREPLDDSTLSKSLGFEPNFMIRKGMWKLIITKKADAPVKDMLFNLRLDPYEMNNLLGDHATTDRQIGKAEHLKILLVEWMKRHDGPDHLYSDPVWNGGEGRGDIKEIMLRRTWRRVDFWLSDRSLPFWRAAREGDQFERHEYLYMGRTTPGKLLIENIEVKGPDSSYFTIDVNKAAIQMNDFLRVRVTYRSSASNNIGRFNAYIEISNSATGVSKVVITGRQF